MSAAAIGADAFALDELAASAWPATETVRIGRFLCRHTPSIGRRRSNSALPLGPGPTAQDIDAVEAHYEQRGQPARFQVSPAELREELDTALAARGYRLDGPTDVLTAPVSRLTGEPSPDLPGDWALERNRPRRGAPITCRSSPVPDDLWLAAWRAAEAREDIDATAAEVLPRIGDRASYWRAEHEGVVAGVALTVTDGQWIGIYTMAVHPSRRRHGIARALLRTIARDTSARRLYLLVERENVAAQKLYASAGFRPSHTYHYRVLG